MGRISDNYFDPVCSKKLADLTEQLNRAIYYNNYEHAKIINELIERIRVLGYKIEHLNNLKKLACDRDDYIKAKIIKEQIDKNKKIINDINIGQFSLPQPPQIPSRKMSNVRLEDSSNMGSALLEEIKSYKIIEERKLHRVTEESEGAGSDVMSNNGGKKDVENIKDYTDKIIINGEEFDLNKKNQNEIKNNINKRHISSGLTAKSESEIMNKTYSIEDSVREELSVIK